MQQGFSQPMALVVQTRDYQRSDVVAGLVERGFLISEIPYGPGTASSVESANPQVLILALDPSRAHDIASVAALARRSQAFILCLVAEVLPGQAAALLDAGADAVLRESDGPEVVPAQVNALMRRQERISSGEAGAGRITVQDLIIDPEAHTVMQGGRLVPIPELEFQILATLARNTGRVVSAVELARAVHGESYSEKDAQAVVKTYIARLRRKLGDDARAPRYIVNVRTVGYMLERRPREGRNRPGELRLITPRARRQRV